MRELFFDFLMELIPDAVSETIGEWTFGRIKARVRSKPLRVTLYILLALGFAVVGVGLAFAVIMLIATLTAR